MTGIRRSGWWRRAVVVLAVVVVATIAALEVYTRLPVGERTPDLALPPSPSTGVLVIHGAGDADNPLMPVIAERLEGAFRDRPDAVVRYLRWDPESDDRLRAAATARAVGRRVGARLAALGSLRELHLVAHSVGTFMPDAICEVLRAAPSPPRVTMVLLDPFQISGFVDWSWGARHHGECADFALAVMNLDDPAPATNRPLRQAYNLDVTGDPDRAGFPRNGHYWPLQYYLDHLAARQADMVSLGHADLPRGALRDAAGDPGLMR
jgi:hypothetical protein